MPYLSGDTTVFSNLSLSDEGRLAASRVSSSGTIIAPEVWASTFSIGGFGLPTISSTSSLVAALVVQGSASSFTVITWSAVNPGDQILTAPLAGGTASSVSSGLVPWSHCTVAGQFEFRLSNVSTLVQNQSSKSWIFTRISPTF